MFEIIGIAKKNDLTYCVTKPRHPKARGKRGLYPLHVVVAENALDRLLEKDEEIRHINGHRFDNTVKNLAIVKGSSLVPIADLCRAVL